MSWVEGSALPVNVGCESFCRRLRIFETRARSDVAFGNSLIPKQCGSMRERTPSDESASWRHLFSCGVSFLLAISMSCLYLPTTSHCERFEMTEALKVI